MTLKGPRWRESESRTIRVTANRLVSEHHDVCTTKDPDRPGGGRELHGHHDERRLGSDPGDRDHTRSGSIAARLRHPRWRPVIVSSGDGGWIHLGPHVAELLAANGFFVVGFDVKAYLERFTSGKTTLRPEDEPSDYKVIADFAARGTSQKPILIGVSEGAGLSVLAATDPRMKTRSRE